MEPVIDTWKNKSKKENDLLQWTNFSLSKKEKLSLRQSVVKLSK